MLDLHNRLLNKSNTYRNWHSWPMHKIIHWLIFIAIAFGLTSVIVSNADYSAFSEKSVSTPTSKKVTYGRILVKASKTVTETDTFQSALRQANAEIISTNSATDLAKIGITIIESKTASSAAVAKTISKLPGVEFTEFDKELQPLILPDDPIIGYHIQNISAPEAWDTNQCSAESPVVIAVVDTGVDGTHPDLQPKMVPGRNIFDNNDNTADVHGHGTSVASVAAAATNNTQGIAGIGWNCKIMPIRISNTSGLAYMSTIAAGIIWAADHGAKVATNSYASASSFTVQYAAQYFTSQTQGVVTIASGNDGQNYQNPDNPYILAIGATDSNNNRASFSTYGNFVDLVAPGVGIKTANRGGGYGSGSGTSFSTPIAAGVAALVISDNPNLTSEQVTYIMQHTATDLGSPGKDIYFGWGKVDAKKSVECADNQRADSTICRQ